MGEFEKDILCCRLNSKAPAITSFRGLVRTQRIMPECIFTGWNGYQTSFAFVTFANCVLILTWEQINKALLSFILPVNENDSARQG